MFLLPKGFIVGIEVRKKQWADPCCEKPKLDGFSLKNCDEDLLLEEVVERHEFNLVLLATGRQVGMTLVGLPALDASSDLISSDLISFHRLSPTGKRTKATAQ